MFRQWPVNTCEALSRFLNKREKTWDSYTKALYFKTDLHNHGTI